MIEEIVNVANVLAGFNSNLILCRGIKLDRNYKNVLSYNEKQMLELINSKKVKEFKDMSYIEKDKNVIMVEAKLKDIYNCNYLAFKNPDYNNKWFYAFIDNVSYLSESACKVTFTIDVWSTWFMDWDPTTCYVIREHVKDDTLGKNTIPENILTGDYKIINLEYFDDFNFENLDIVLGCTIDPTQSTNNNQVATTGIYQGVPTGCGYFAYRNSTTEVPGIDELRENLQNLTNIGARDSVTGLFLAPQMLTNRAKGLINNSLSNSKINKLLADITHIGSLDGYVPKNKKTLCYPYCFIRISNGAGSSIILKPELWDGRTKQVRIEASMTPGCSIILYPMDYEGSPKSIPNSLVLGKFPQLNYSTDGYTNWLVENGLNHAYSYLNNGISIASNIASGVGDIMSGQATGESLSNNAKGVIGSAENIANTMYSSQLADRIPPTFSGVTNAGDVMTTGSNNNFLIEYVTVKEEYGRIIDDYFTRYGYKVNALKVPNISTRSVFNYLQIAAGEKIGYGNVPAADMSLINQIAQAGVTIWHDHSKIGTYK